MHEERLSDAWNVHPKSERRHPTTVPVTLCRIRQTHAITNVNIWHLLKCVSSPFCPLDGHSLSGDVRQSRIINFLNGFKTARKLSACSTHFFLPETNSEIQPLPAGCALCPLVLRFLLYVFCTWLFYTCFFSLDVLQGPLLQEMGRIDWACSFLTYLCTIAPCALLVRFIQPLGRPCMLL